MKSLICKIAVLTLFFAGHIAEADDLEVNLPGHFDKHSLELAAGQRATITVYLKSAGDVLDDFKVDLIDEAAHKVVDSGKSDKDGIVVFHSRPAGRYVVLLDIPKKVRRISTASLGDVRITPEGVKEGGDIESK